MSQPAPKLDGITTTVCHTQEEWHAERAKGVGASEVAAVLGLNPYCTADDLFAEKLGKPREFDARALERMKWGQRLERVVAEAWEQNTGLGIVANGLRVWRNEAFPGLQATPDYMVFEEIGIWSAVLEIKAVGYTQRSAWKDGAPLHYQAQVQAQMAVCGVGQGYLAVLIGGQEFRSYEFVIDPDFVSLMAKAVADFWQRVEAARAEAKTHE